MAVQFSATDNHLGFSATFAASNAANTFCYWAYFSTALTTTQCLLSLTVYTTNPLSVGTGTTTGVQCGALSGQMALWNFGSATATIATTTAPALNTWCHVCFTWDGTTNTVYLNGVASNNSTTARPTTTPQTICFNGYTGGVAAQTSASRIDDMRIYSRALSAAEVMTVYTLQGLRDNITYGLGLCAPFDGAAGASATGAICRVTQTPMTASGSGTTPLVYASSTLSLVRSGGSC